MPLFLAIKASLRFAQEEMIKLWPYISTLCVEEVVNYHH